ncbi:hypothetical protein A3742_11170 [Oleiphilus sp. HI0071]|uniref:DM13 domain-containing protein n=1 Tax=unclassified Oleiphilus TaxID=2631174 RepID=UPI0007C3F4A0|nr:MULTISPECIES: DM13 domain-containing protein [unclassified Oleiphilus]KZY62225.1 hypothetical protein A3737_04355 [Oleiphilus sp. HI0065]KZY81695.1 hypothetical protein A3742_11170 [Oleiphilus sp. HI0071]KZZ00849.1 hypothetical protein A3744_11970 [Oleiphilus sp. HI0073]KZZ46325.1 hypothetical protein A3758_37035 [Oleiphilus sp. HI0118]KZZ48220.1 hypothetical protein A3760_04115 [Oleiphilus sp. HI0122]KZZ78204.1 hypothetical protein A3765_08265 [Oleiphilus sp. HI0130]KZZ78576.1 hypothetic
MNIRKLSILTLSHAATCLLGFAIGIYTLPILLAPDSPDESALSAAVNASKYTAEFQKDLTDSDAFHWGEGVVSISSKQIAFKGELAPGPDYKLYLSPAYLETEAEFHRLKPSMVKVGDIKTFDNFIVSIPAEIDPFQYSTVIVWCETFSEFITAAQYQSSPSRAN